MQPWCLSCIKNVGIRAVLASVHGVEKMDAELSDFYMVDEMHSTYWGHDDCDSRRLLEEVW